MVVISGDESFRAAQFLPNGEILVPMESPRWHQGNVSVHVFRVVGRSGYWYNRRVEKHDLQDLAFRLARPFLGAAEVRIASGGCGLFGDFFMTLDGLLFCEGLGLSGRPDWNERCLYFDESRGSNAWDYFFEPVITAERRFSVPYFPSARHFLPTPDASARRVAARAVQRLGKVRPELEAIAQRFIAEELEGGAYLGVHVRGTDARTGSEGRKTAEQELLDRVLEERARRHPDHVIFLATDEEPTVERLRSRWGDRLRVRNCIRSTDGRSVHGHYDDGQGGSPYQKGVDVVIDALLLARCRHLIRGHSRVTMYSLALNPDLEFTDVDVLGGEAPRVPWLYD